MKKFIALCTVIVCSSGLVIPQSRRDAKPKPTTTKKTEDKQASTVGLGFSSVVKDHRGGVWITGTAFLLAGLMINDRNGEVRPVVVPDVHTVSKPIFVTAETGWMAARQNLYRTSDAGQSWRKIKVPGLLRIGTVHFLDSQNGWVGGAKGDIYRTTDGGETWRKAVASQGYNIGQIFFIDPLHGWAIGTSVVSTQKSMRGLFRTSDGGDTWEELSNGDPDAKGSVESVCFLDRQNGWGIEGWQHNIIRTRDGGQTWTIQQLELNPKTGMNSVFFLDNLHGWAIGRGIAHTFDGGASWSYQVNPETSDATFEEITFIDGNRGWAVGTDKVLRTMDGGKTWSPLPDDWKKMLPDFDTLLRLSEKRN